MAQVCENMSHFIPASPPRFVAVVEEIAVRIRAQGQYESYCILFRLLQRGLLRQVANGSIRVSAYPYWLINVNVCVRLPVIH